MCHYVGLDVSKAETAICILDEKGNIHVMNTITANNPGPGSCIRKISVVVKGSVDGETLIVQSVSRDVESQP